MGKVQLLNKGMFGCKILAQFAKIYEANMM